jgi:hypothetical protein
MNARAQGDRPAVRSTGPRDHVKMRLAQLPDRMQAGLEQSPVVEADDCHLVALDVRIIGVRNAVEVESNGSAASPARSTV